MFILNILFSIGNIGFQSVNAEIPVTDTQFRTPQSLFKFNASEWFFVSWVGGSRNFLQFKDDFSSYVTLYFLKNKSEVKDCFLTICND